MGSKSKQKCQVCQKEFKVRDLYPTALVRSNVLSIAMKRYPDLREEGFVCIPDLRKISAMHFKEIIRQERGALTELEEEVIQSLQKHELLSENINEEFEETLSSGGRLADIIAKFGGSWTFILIFAVVLLSWMVINSLQFFQGEPFDPYPFILLNLVLSSLAAIQAPIIMMSQNRQSLKDRLSQENDYQINLKAELQIRQINARLELFMKHNWQKMHEISRNQEAICDEIKQRKRS